MLCGSAKGYLGLVSSSAMSTKARLAGGYRQKDNPLWNRPMQLKVLNQFHKGVTLRGLRELRFGSPAKRRRAPPATASSPRSSGRGGGGAPDGGGHRHLSRSGSRAQLLPPASPMAVASSSRLRRRSSSAASVISAADLDTASPRGGSDRWRTCLDAENEEVMKCMARRGPASVLKHPPVSVEYRLSGRDAVVPFPETIQDVNMFISDTGNINAKVGDDAVAHVGSSLERQIAELTRLGALIRGQASGTSTNTSLSRFRARFSRSRLFFTMASSAATSEENERLERQRNQKKSRPQMNSSSSHTASRTTTSTNKVKATMGSGVGGLAGQYLREALRDICVGIKLIPNIAPAFFNRALVLRKLLCHEAALGDVAHALTLLDADVGDNELARIKYMRLAGLLERECGLFVEAGMEYDRVKVADKEQRQKQRRERRARAQARIARAKAKEKAKREREAALFGDDLLKELEEEEAAAKKAAEEKKKNSLKARLQRLTRGGGGGPEDQGENDEDDDDAGDTSTSRKKAKKAKKRVAFGGMASIVHQATGGKHMSAVQRAKQRFLHGLLSPIARSMAGTIPGHRTPMQIKRIVQYVYSSKSDDLISLGPELLEQVSQWLTHRSVAAGSYVFRQGEPQDAFYVLASGMCKVMVRQEASRGGGEVVVKTLLGGDSFGQIHFPTDEELEQQKQWAAAAYQEAKARKRRLEEEIAKAMGREYVPEAEEEEEGGERGAERQDGTAGRRSSAVQSKSWLSSRKRNPVERTRRASIYASRHCELLVLSWSHIEHTLAREAKREEAREAKRREAEREQKQAQHALRMRQRLMRRMRGNKGKKKGGNEEDEDEDEEDEDEEAKKERERQQAAMQRRLLLARQATIIEFQRHTIARRFSILRHCHAFRFLHDEDVKSLATAGAVHRWSQGMPLLRQGETMDRVLVLFRGVCKVIKRRPKTKHEAFSPTGGGEDPLEVGMLWQQQYQQHMNHRSQNMVLEARRAKRDERRLQHAKLRQKQQALREHRKVQRAKKRASLIRLKRADSMRMAALQKTSEDGKLGVVEEEGGDLTDDGEDVAEEDAKAEGEEDDDDDDGDGEDEKTREGKTEEQHLEDEYMGDDGEDQWVRVGTVKAGDICGEMVLLNPQKTTVSPVQIVADSSVDALVLSLGELRVFLDRGMFSGRTRNALVDSVGTNVPCDTKVKCNLAYMERWNRQKSTIVRALVRGHRHPPEEKKVDRNVNHLLQKAMAPDKKWNRKL